MPTFPKPYIKIPIPSHEEGEIANISPSYNQKLIIPQKWEKLWKNNTCKPLVPEEFQRLNPFFIWPNAQVRQQLGGNTFLEP